MRLSIESASCSSPFSAISDLSVLHHLREAFAQLPDTRQAGKVLHSQVRDTNAAHNLSILRELLINVLRSLPGTLSLRRKRRLAALDPAFRFHILASLHA